MHPLPSLSYSLKFSRRDLRKVLVVSSWFGLSHKQIWDADLLSEDNKCICELQKSVCEPQKVRTAVGMHQESTTQDFHFGEISAGEL